MTEARKLVPAKIAAGITHTSPASTTGRWALQLPAAADAQKVVSPDVRTLTCGSFEQRRNAETKWLMEER